MHLIDKVGPALRGLLAENGKLPLVRFTPEQTDFRCPKVQLPEDSDSAQIVETLGKVLDRSTEPVRALYVEGLGSFMIRGPESTLAGRVAGKVAMVTGAALAARPPGCVQPSTSRRTSPGCRMASRCAIMPPSDMP